MVIVIVVCSPPGISSTDAISAPPRMRRPTGTGAGKRTRPVPAGARIRASLETTSVDEAGDGWYQLVQKWTVEIEGQEKPALFAESVVRLLA